MATNQILVPLDGSPLAEIAIPEARQLAKALDSKVVLLQVVASVEEVIESGTMRIAVDEIWSSQRDAALRYLHGLQTREFAGLRTEVMVEQGSPAETILDVARTRNVDRIVMATHGRTGMTRWVFGSVAEKVLRAADRVVVLVRAPWSGNE